MDNDYERLPGKDLDSLSLCPKYQIEFQIKTSNLNKYTSIYFKCFLHLHRIIYDYGKWIYPVISIVGMLITIEITDLEDSFEEF